MRRCNSCNCCESRRRCYNNSRCCSIVVIGSGTRSIVVIGSGTQCPRIAVTSTVTFGAVADYAIIVGARVVIVTVIVAIVVQIVIIHLYMCAVIVAYVVVVICVAAIPVCVV